MADRTAIEWCDATLNLWWGCTKVSEGCKHCYADTLSHRYNRAIWGPKGTRVEVKGWRSTLNKISKRAKDEGRRLKVFCQSMSDTFEGPETCGGIESENWDTIVRLRCELLEAIRDHQELDFLLLTKRPEKVNLAIREWLENSTEREGDEILGECGFPPNLWMGTSVENQEAADKRIPELLKIPAKVRFLSCEPLIGPVDLDVPMCDICYSASDLYPDHDGLRCAECDGHEACYGWFEDRIHWVICGGESGANARPMHPNWARSLRDQCQESEVAFFFKQWGEWGHISHRFLEIQ